MKNPEKLIGKLVKITDKESNYYGHWGFIRDWDGDVFHVSGGSQKNVSKGLLSMKMDI